MKKPVLIGGVICLLVAIIWVLWPEKSHAIYAIEQPINKSPDVTSFKTPETKPSERPVPPVTIKKQFDDSIKQAAKQVAKQYQATLSFPPYSQPLTQYDEDRLKPNQFHPVSVPVNDQGKRLSLNLAQYRYVFPEKISAVVEGDNINELTVRLIDVGTKKIISERNIAGRHTQYNIEFNGAEDLPRNLEIEVKAEIDGNMIPVVAQLQYMQASAILTELGQPWANNDKMAIPITLKVFQPGFYRVRANLFSGTVPLAHLVTKEHLDKGYQQMTLNAHWSVLKDQSQVMSLQGFVIEMMSPAPGKPSIYGDSKVKQFEITDFPVNSLQKIPYEPSQKERQSLRFLTDLSS